MDDALEILVLDDDLVDRRAVKRALAAGGLNAKLLEFEDPTDALGALRNAPVDCILLDYQLPKVDGLDVLEHLRAERPATPVIVLTGHGDEELAVEVMKAGASDYLAKASLSPNRLCRSIIQAVELARAQRTAQRADANRQEAEKALELLAKAGKNLAVALDLPSTLDALMRVFVPDWADWCAVVLRESDGSLSLASCVGIDPSTSAKIGRFIELVSFDPGAEIGSGYVTRTGSSQVFARVTEEDLRTFARHDETALEVLRELDIGSLIVVPLETQGRVIGSLHLCSGRSARRYSRSQATLAEEVGRRAAVAIENARLFEVAQRERRRAEEASRAKDEFLAVVSHEVRTPLNAILGWAKMLQTGSLDAEQSKRAIATIERNAKSQAQLIEDLLDVARIVSGKLRIEVGPVDLRGVVESAIDVVRPAADAKNVRVQAILDDTLGPIMGDADRLQQVAWNLLSNAVKFTPRQGRVVVRLQRVDSSVVLTVEDTGKGIAPAFLPHIFDRFQQAEMGTTRSMTGLGLGLAIVKHIAELHGGSIEAASEGADKGATFVLRLPVSPLRPAAASSVPPLARSDRPGSDGFLCPPEVAGLRILVLDDEADARELLASMLEHCGAKVIAAASVEQAFALFVAERPDIVLSDIGMPVEDGYSFISRIRSLPADRGGGTQAVALTAYARAEDRTRALQAGFNMHLPKPVEPTELLVVIASVIARRGV